MEKKKYSIWFYFILFVIPFLIIFILEVSLRFFNYGVDYTTFVEIEEISEGQYFFNPDVTKKFFTNTTAIPSVLPEPFDKQKNKNSIRIFVLGGSTTAGYPYSANAAFPRRLKRKLEMFYPENKIEVVNLGVSAVNSHFLRNILPDVIEQQPDLILIYAGHNEFYGVLGPASNEYISSSPGFIQFLLDLREFKTYQLMQNVTAGIVGLFSNPENKDRGTLMSEMIREQKVPTGSEIYKEGLNQYQENMNAILELCKENNIPVLIGDLVSNLKQPPLLSRESNADVYFSMADQYLESLDTVNAKMEYVKAKDTDLLKFRATEDFNQNIDNLAGKFDLTPVRIKQIFEDNSEYGITGFNLMVDHLHPNLEGYKLMADQFYAVVDKVISKKFKKNTQISTTAIDEYLEKNFPFGRYDSTLADITISVLLNDFPFKENSDFSLSNYPLLNYEDSLAMQTVSEGLGWANAQLKIFDHYYNSSNYKKAARALFILMEDRPFYKRALEYAIPKLLAKGFTEEAKHILVRNYNRYPDFFTAKNLGIINVNQGNAALAKKLLLQADEYLQNDPEIYFNLSKAYYALREIDNAISSMQRCLQISPDYPGGRNILNRLQSISNNRQN